MIILFRQTFGSFSGENKGVKICRPSSGEREKMASAAFKHGKIFIIELQCCENIIVCPLHIHLKICLNVLVKGV